MEETLEEFLNRVVGARLPYLGWMMRVPLLAEHEKKRAAVCAALKDDI